ncbi:cytosine permease [Sphingobium yanoikuyae]|jgi:cytosine permease|uniref:Cytosine permease n=1 Tax=Sphingobium yanoikuyae TaxID=13690 RepID=A0A9X7U672_SPHYA|nr:cytosine permease [Sphingobium yanoikuyae]QNG44466.1 cytosine permease [Sphingobium yanoikuyae]
MEMQSDESSHHGYAAERVPESAQGSGWRIFFIVAGSLCGLPVFILSARIFGGLGFSHGLLAVLLGAGISAILGACSAYTGSSARMGLAMLADHAFGPWGSGIVKLVIAISLVGWFGVNIGVLGATAASALSQMSGWHVPPLAIGLPVSLAIAATTIAGATGLERLGSVLVPVTLIVLLASVGLSWRHLDTAMATTGTGEIGFGGAVAAIVGSYVVGIVIQPDYGRFVRRPWQAAMGAGLSLGVAYPLVMILSSLASLALGAPELISAMILLGFGVPALAVLLLGAWIDSSACLYSASLSFANQLPRLGFAAIVATITLVGILLVVVGADTVFIPFLMTLGVALPPLATVLILSHFLVRVPASFLSSVTAAICWATGTATGGVTTQKWLTLSGLPVLDSIVITCLTLTIFNHLIVMRHTTS